jgi:hypothetical protein
MDGYIEEYLKVFLPMRFFSIGDECKGQSSCALSKFHYDNRELDAEKFSTKMQKKVQRSGARNSQNQDAS